MREVPLLDDPWVLVAPAGTQAAMGVIELDQLRLPWLEVDRSSGVHQAAARVRDRLSSSTTSPHRYASHQSALALIAAGEGVALLPQLALQEFSLTGVETHELPGLGSRRISVRYRVGRRPDPAVAAAVEFLQLLTAPGETAADHPHR